MINKDFFLALDELEASKKIKKEAFLEALESALVSAYKRHYGEANSIQVKLNPARNTIRIFAYKTVVENVINKDKEVSLEEARQIKKTAKIGDIISKEITPKEFGRIAAQTAKQVVTQKLRDMETQIAYEELAEKEDELTVCVIRRIEGKNVYVDLGKLEAVMLPSDQIPDERYNVNDKIKVYVKKVKVGPKGPQIMVSRSCEGFVKRLFEQEVPEIAAGLVVIKNIVREAGYRTKIAVYSEDSSIDPVGACVGNRGMRINTIVAELNGEKIDVIPWCSDTLEYIARALSPAKVLMVQVNDEDRTAKVIVPDDKLSLAIGKRGQNARLAVRLTGWKIDVKSLSASQNMEEFKEIEEHIPEEDFELEDFKADLGEL
ncbi:MAG TPA: transcription termination/antitermination protein NusA [Clostridiales bacterium]|nr:transcription termination/antitermination protein NusA [Clostridiales bacterium]